MKRNFAVAVLALVCAGCSNPQASIVIKNAAQTTVLEGEMESRKQTATLSVQNGELSCSGEGVRTLDQMNWMSVLGTFDFVLSCSDGRSSNVTVNLRTPGGADNWQGTGKGKFDDGTPFMVIVGPYAATASFGLE